MAELTDAEREALDVMGMFPTPQGFADPAAWGRGTESRLAAQVERIVAARVQQAVSDEQGLWAARLADEVSRAEAAEAERDRTHATLMEQVGYIDAAEARAEAAEAERDRLEARDG